MSVQLSVSGDGTDVTQTVMKDLKKCNIDFENTGSASSKAFVSFTQKGDKYEAQISMLSPDGKPIISGNKLVFKKPDGVGAEIALRMFGKGGSIAFEPHSNS